MIVLVERRGEGFDDGAWPRELNLLLDTGVEELFRVLRHGGGQPTNHSVT